MWNFTKEHVHAVLEGISAENIATTILWFNTYSFLPFYSLVCMPSTLGVNVTEECFPVSYYC